MAPPEAPIEGKNKNRVLQPPSTQHSDARPNLLVNVRLNSWSGRWCGGAGKPATPSVQDVGCRCPEGAVGGKNTHAKRERHDRST